jgi:epoxyqueuosine reductase
VGFSLCGIARLDPAPPANDAFARWIEQGMHGDMACSSAIARCVRTRETLLPAARSASASRSTTTSPPKNQRSMDGRDTRALPSMFTARTITPSCACSPRSTSACVARFPARGRAPPATFSSCVGSHTGHALGDRVAWARTTQRHLPEHGSWIFLGELRTLDLRADEPLETLCAGCTKCIDACPTGALDTLRAGCGVAFRI